MAEVTDGPPPPRPSAVPLFRPQATGQAEYGGGFAFAPPGWRAIGALALLAVALVATFSLFANFDRKAAVPGVVVPASGVTRLIAPRAGIISAVLVRQGSFVRRGTPLIRVGIANVVPTGAATPEEVVQTFRHQQLLAQAERRAEQAVAAVEGRRLAEQAAEQDATAGLTRAQITIQEDRIERNERRLRSLAALRAQGYISEVTYQTQEELVLTQRQQLLALRQREAEAGHAASRAHLQLRQLDAGDRRAALRASAVQLEMERGAADAQGRAELTLTAPADGLVAALAATPGLAVPAGSELAALVDSTAALEVRLYVPPADAGYLSIGQSVSLRFDAFPWQQHGAARGVIREIATTAAAGPEGPAYRVRVVIIEGAVGVPRSRLRPDMGLSASITLERRTLIEWLLAPIREAWRENRRS